MATNTTDGKTVFGWIVAGDDNTPDPQASGRVKFMTAFHHPDTPIDQLPWSQIAAQPGNVGGLSFHRPPQLGSMVEVYFPQGAKGSGHGIIRSLLHNIQNPNGGSGGSKGGDVNLVTQDGWAKTARETKPSKASGPARVEEVLEDNPTSKVQKLTTKVTYDDPPAMKDRDGTNSSGVNKATLKMITGINDIATAAQTAYFKFDPSGAFGMPSFSLPGINIDLKGLVDQLIDSIGNDSLKMGMQSISNMLPTTTITISTVANMSNSGGLTDPAAWLSQAQSMLSKATSHLELQNGAFQLNTQSLLSSLLSGQSISQSIETLIPGFSISRIIDPTGKIEIPDISSFMDLLNKVMGQGINMMASAATRGGVTIGGNMFGPAIMSNPQSGVHSGLTVLGDLLSKMDDTLKSKQIQLSINTKFANNPDVHDIGLHFAWFMSGQGKSGRGNTVRDDGRFAQYKAGSAIV